jgi:hypothetical protein
VVLVAQVLRALAPHLRSSALLLQPPVLHCSTQQRVTRAVTTKPTKCSLKYTIPRCNKSSVNCPRALLSTAYVTHSQALSLSQSSLGTVALPPSSRLTFIFFINRLTGLDHPDTLLCM